MQGEGVFGSAFRVDLARLFAWRRDVRRFRPDPLPQGTFERLAELASLSPSVGLSQPWRFVRVETPTLRALVRASFESCNAQALRSQPAAHADHYARMKLAGLGEAPCQFALFADRGTAKGRGLGRLTMPETIEYSAVMAVHTMWLAARAEGIGLGWVSILDAATVTAALDVPPDWRLVGYFCLGYPIAEDDAPELEREGWERRGEAAATIFVR